MNNINLEPLNVSTIKRTVYKKLVNAIISGKIPPGTQLTLSQLAKQLGVSILPIREALGSLEAEKLIFVKNRRISVAKLSSNDLKEILDIRLNLECMAIKRAISKYDNAVINRLECHTKNMLKANNAESFLAENKFFHFTLYESSDMPILIEVIEYLWKRVSPYLHIYVFDVDYSRTTAVNCHKKMIKAIREKDQEKLCKELTLDLTLGAERVINYFQAKESDSE